MTAFQNHPPASMLLAPRVTLTGDPSASVQGINTTVVADGALVYCLENAETFRLDRADSTTPPNGTTVIAPFAGPGRWKGPLGGTGSAISIGDAADAASLMNPGDAPGFAQIAYSMIGPELCKIDLASTMGAGGTGPAGYGLEVPLPPGFQVAPSKIVGGGAGQDGSNFSVSGYCVIASMTPAFNSLLATYAISNPLTAIRVATFAGDIGATTVVWAAGDLIRCTLWVPVVPAP